MDREQIKEALWGPVPSVRTLFDRDGDINCVSSRKMWHGNYDDQTGYRMVRAAAVHFVPWKWHKDRNADRMEELFVAAVEAGAELVVAPEGCLEGYVVAAA